jgi:hypothetical protein
VQILSTVDKPVREPQAIGVEVVAEKDLNQPDNRQTKDLAQSASNRSIKFRDG